MDQTFVRLAISALSLAHLGEGIAEAVGRVVEESATDVYRLEAARLRPRPHR